MVSVSCPPNHSILMKPYRFAILVVAVSLLAFTYPAKDVKLEYTFKAGDLYVMDQVSKQNIKQDIPGMGEISIDVGITGSMSFKIVEVTPTGGKLETAYTGLKMTTKSTMGESVMDSEGPDDNLPNKVVKALINKSFFVYMN